MENLFIFKMQFPSLSLANNLSLDIASFKQYLDPIMNFTFPSINAQQNTNWRCFIQYDTAHTPLLTQLLPLYPNLNTSIHFTSTLSNDIHSYLDSTDLSQYQTIFFIHLSPYILCPIDFFDNISSFILSPSTRILQLTTSINYNPFTHSYQSFLPPTPTNFIYVCSVSEYIRYFKIYDKLHPEILMQHFSDMPTLLFPLPLLNIESAIFGGKQ